MHLRLLSAGFFLAMLAGCFGSLPPAQSHEKILMDGRWVEPRINRNLSRRPEEVYYVYLDSSGNYVRHGTDLHFYLDGQIKLEEHYRDGLLDSVSEFWYPSGAKRGELPYSEGKPDGKALTWYSDGMKESETNWKNGQLDGLSLRWNEKGDLIKKTLWSGNHIDTAGSH
jgi:antitoxin component YwqK of YwqJK toxin-antitoxin module